jgi:hypothetical protein
VSFEALECKEERKRQHRKLVFVLSGPIFQH